MTKILIDTNVYSDAMKGAGEAVDILRKASDILVSPVVIAELLSGFKRGNKEKENRGQLRQFLAKPGINVSDITEETADRYSFIFSNLKEAGTPIPTNDIWIAASAMEQGAKLVSRDQHFQKINGLFLVSC